jgi:T-complex protein 1 subunit alpha
VKTEKLGRDIPFQIAKTTLSSKIFGRESDFFANLAVDAMAMVKEVRARRRADCATGCIAYWAPPRLL